MAKTNRIYIVIQLLDHGSQSQEKKTLNFEEAKTEYEKTAEPKRLIQVIKCGEKIKEKIIFTTYL
jgi:hypothetical protein